MKNLSLLLLLCLVAHLSLAQTTFEYDAAGNRIKRLDTPVPDLTLTAYVRPTTIYGTSPISFVADIINLGTAPTSGLLWVYIAKNAKISFSFDTSLTMVDNRGVLNSAWSFDATSNASYYILTTNQVIDTNSALSFGLTGVLTPGNSDGRFGISSVVFTDEDAETNLGNNSAAIGITYFQQ